MILRTLIILPVFFVTSLSQARGFGHLPDKQLLRVTHYPFVELSDETLSCVYSSTKKKMLIKLEMEKLSPFSTLDHRRTSEQLESAFGGECELLADGSYAVPDSLINSKREEVVAVTLNQALQRFFAPKSRQCEVTLAEHITLNLKSIILHSRAYKRQHSQPGDCD